MTTRFRLLLHYLLIIVVQGNCIGLACANDRLPQGLVQIINYVTRPGGVLSVCDGEVFFKGENFPLGFNSETFRANQKFDIRMKVWSYTFRQEGDHLRLFLLDREKGLLRAHDAVNGYYLTADYSTFPPRVRLTETPGKYSRWELIPVEGAPLVRGGRVIDRYIRNLNDTDQNAWLYWMNDGYVRSGPGTSDFSALLPVVLSFDKKVVFNVSPFHGEEGK